jgi:hypothetical protein
MRDTVLGFLVWCGVVWCGVVWCGVVWCGVVWCGGAVATSEQPGQKWSCAAAATWVCNEVAGLTS